MDNWYNTRFTIHPDKTNRSLNATTLAVPQLLAAPAHWHGHSTVEQLEKRVPIVACMLTNTEDSLNDV